MDEILQLVSSNPEECLNKLRIYLSGRETDLEALQLAAEVHFELGNGELAYEALQRALQLDPKGEIGGTNKFLWMGQLTGGREGLEYYQRGITNNPDTAQAVNCYLGMIEIWMTDLCMEPEAEEQCEHLIARALLLDEGNPEALSILGSIRISQQKPEEAAAILQQAWALFPERATVASLPSLIRLAQSMLECGLYEDVLDLTVVCTKLDDEVPDLYYLNAYAHKQAWDACKEDRHAAGAHDAVELLSGLPEADPEMVRAAAELVEGLPKVDLQPSDDEIDQGDE